MTVRPGWAKRRHIFDRTGGARVVYFFHDRDVPIFLLALYAKNEKSDLSAADKKEFARFGEEFVAQRKRK